MDRRFDMNDYFEQTLKEYADQFRMIPSQRVWNGLYNNLHPGSRWPSITVAIAFIMTIVTLGNMHNRANIMRAENTSSGPLPSQVIKAGGEDAPADRTAPLSAGLIRDEKEQPHMPSVTSRTAAGRNVAPYRIASLEAPSKTDFSEEKRTTVDLTLPALSAPAPNSSVSPTAIALHSPETVLPEGEYKPLSNNLQQAETISFAEPQEKNIPDPEKNIPDGADPENDPAYLFSYTIKNTSYSIVPSLPASSLSAHENSYPAALHAQATENKSSVKNHPAHTKKKRRAQLVYFATATVSSATFRDEAAKEMPQPGSSMLMSRSSRPASDIIFNARLGFEAGGHIEYKFARNLKFITGLSLSYMGYNIMATAIHPTSTSVLLKGENQQGYYIEDYVTRYSNNKFDNRSRLSNYSLQLGLPVGLEYTFWQNNNTQLSVQSTLQPFTLLKSNAYLISSDGRYYVQDPSLQRKINITSTLEPFISFAASRFKWHIGPQIRYNLLSTYKKNYSITEHLIDYGIKIGISK